MNKETCQFRMVSLITTILKTLRGLESQHLSKFSLSHFHARYIIFLSMKKQMTMSELTESIGVDKANTTRAIQDLTKKGYIEKIGQGTRNSQIKLTESGEEVAQDLKKHLKTIAERTFKGFTKQDMDSLYNLTEKFMLGVKNAGIN